MPHFPKPFFVKARGVWRVQIRGTQYNLGPDRNAAFRRYHELLSKPAPVRADLTLGLIDGFLDWCQKHRAPRTYRWYRDHLQSFTDSLPSPELLRVDELRPFHLLAWADAHPTWGNSHRRGALTAVQRAFSWAEKVGHIDKSPVRHVEKPEYGRREQLVTASEFDRILAHVPDPEFRDLLEFVWETGARPQEVRVIEARHLNPARTRVELPPAEAKGKRRWRVIYLTHAAAGVARRLADRHPAGPLFRNRGGRAWAAQAFNCRFDRLKKKLGIKYALYSFRHSFANRLLEAGVDHLTVSQLLGHADGTMLARVYAHLDQSSGFLQNELEKGTRTGTASRQDA